MSSSNAQVQLRTHRGAIPNNSFAIVAGAGIPTLHYGPGDVRLAHGPEEAVEVDEVIRVVEALVLTTLRTCGTHDS